MNISEFSGELFIDPQFNLADPVIHHTVICFSKSGFSIIIADTESKRVVFAAISKHTSQTQSESEKDITKDLGALSEIIPADGHASVIFSDKRAVLIPGNISDDNNNISATFGLNFDQLPDEVILCSPVDEIGATMVFGVNKKSIDLAEKMFTNHKKFYLGSVIISKDHRRSGKKDGADCSVYLTDNEFFVHAMQNDKTSYFNSFSYKTPEEFVYYMVAIANTLEVPVASFRVTVSGLFKAECAAIRGLREIFADVSFGQGLINSDIIPVSKRYLFNELTALISCEL